MQLLLVFALAFVPLAQQRGNTGWLELPEPTGEFSVGQASFSWLDDSRLEGATEVSTDHRWLPVLILYPASREGGGAEAPYLADLGPFRQVWRPETVHLVEKVGTNSRLEAPVSQDQARFPVVLFSHGWGEMASSHRILLEGMASHGYVVVGINHPYMGAIALPEGGVTEPTEAHFEGIGQISEFYGADVRFVLDQLTALDQGTGRLAGRLDLGAVAAIGHSSGFVAVSAACRSDARIRACVNYDAPGFSAVGLVGLRQPLLWVRADRAESPPSGFLERLVAPVYELRIEGARHESFTDWPYLQALGTEARTGVLRQMMEIESRTLGFLDLHLRSYLHSPN